jgi:organic radical activating enzyme
MKDKFFCPEAFAGIRADTSGGYKPCCVFKGNIGSTEQYSPIEVMQSEPAKKLRQAFIDQDKEYLNKHCQSCIQLESDGLKSRRIEAVENYKNGKYEGMEHKLEEAKEDPGSFFHSIEVPSRTGNYCNLKCAMCQPACSSSFSKEVDELGDDSPYEQPLWEHTQAAVKYKNLNKFKWTWKHSDNFDRDMYKILDNVLELKFSGGEPLAAKWNYDLMLKAVEKDKAKDILLQFNTNCTLTSPVKTTEKVSIFDIVKHFKNAQMNVSIEGWGLKNDYIRYPSDFNLILDNARRFASIDCVDVTFVSTVNAINIADLGDIYLNSMRYAEFKPAVAVNYVDEGDPSFMHITAIPDSVKEAQLDKMYSSSKDVAEYLAPYVEMLENAVWNPNTTEKMLSRIVARDKLRGQCLLDHWPEWSEYYEDFLRKNW